MRKLVTRVALLLGTTAGVASAAAVVVHHAAVASQKALVYCPVGVDVAGCSTIVATLGASGSFAGGVDRAYDGSSGTVDLAAVDLAQYAVLVVPSLAADATHEPYAVLSSATVQARLRAGLTGRIAVWAGTPDLGTANRAEKDQLLRNLASWGARDWALAGSTGLVALADLSADAARGYDWIAGVSRVRVTTDAELYGFDAVTTLTGTAKEILKKADGTTPLAYANMASFGISAPDGGVGTRDAEASAATDAGTVTRTVLITAPGGSNTGAATIKTDKADYPPGETVTFTGSGWTPGDTVSITLHENPTEHEDRVLTAVADEAGKIENTNLVMEPHDFGVTFYVTARGGTSGLVAQTSFTDGGFRVFASSGATFTASTIIYPGTTNSCATTPPPAGSITGTLSVTSAGVNFVIPNSNQFAKITIPVASNQGGAYVSATVTGSQATVVSNTLIPASGVRELCIQSGNGSSSNLGTLTVAYGAVAPTSIAVSAATGTFGGTTTLSATLTSNGSPVNGQTIAFTLNGSSVGSATTSASGVATLANASLGTIAVGTYLTGVGASFAGSSSPALAASSGTASLTVGKATPTVTWANPADITYGTALGATQLSATASVAGTFSYTPAAGTVLPFGNGQSLSATFTPTDATNYTTATKTVAINVTKATLAVTANSKTKAYGDAVPALDGTLTGVVAGDDITATYATTATQSSAVGTYPITPTLSDNGTGKLANYTVTSTPGTLTVTGVALTAKADDKTRVFGAADPAFTGSLTGVLAGDDITATYSTTATATSPVGTYDITPALVDPDHKVGNYVVTLTPGKLTITKAPQAISFAPIPPQTFGAGPVTPTATGGASGNPVTFAVDPASAGVCSLSAGATTQLIVASAGSCTIVAHQAGNDNYDSAPDVPQTVTINKASQSITFAALADKTFGDAPFAVSATSSSSLDVAVSASGSCTIAGTTVTITGAGSCTVTASQGGNGNYDAAPSIDRTFTIAKATQAIDFAAPGNKAYGDQPFAVTATGGASGNAVTLSASGACTIAGQTVTIAGAGDCSITAAQAGSDNYLAAEDVTRTFSIARAALTVTTDGKTRTYGAANPELTGVVSGHVYNDAFTATFATTATASSPVGSYPITATIADPGNKLANYDVTNAGGTLTITKAPLSVTPQDASRLYGAANPAFSGDLTGVKNGDAISATYATTADAMSSVGTYDITATLGDPDGKLGNYATTLNVGTLTITQAPLSASAANKSKVYGSANPELTGTVTGLLNGDPITVTYVTDALAESDVGTYAIVPSVHDANDRLKNYAVTQTNGTLEITKATLTVTADDKSRTYGTANPTFTASYAGFVLAQTSSVLGGTLAFDTPATASSHVGSYPVTPNGQTSTNYAITFTNGTLEVTKAPLTIAADDKSRAYGGANPTFTASYAGFVLGETEAVLGAPVSFAGPATTASTNTDVGDYVIDPVGATSTDYAITFVSGKLTITRAPLSVAANNKSRIYGDANPELDGAVTGVVGTDVITATYSTAATPASPVGEYPIVPALVDGGSRLANYDVTSTHGALTVTKAALTITAADKSRVYGSANPELTGAIVGIKNGDGITASYSTSATPASNVGGYDIVPTAVDATPAKLGNYTVSLVNGKLTISQATPTVVWATPAPVPQGTALSGTQQNATISGVNGAGVQGGFTYVPPAGTPMLNVGTQTLTTTFTSQDGNYTNATGSVQLTVANVAPVVTAIALLDKPIALGTTANLTAQFTDPGLNDTHTATIAWDDGQSSAGAVSNRTVTGSHSYGSPGVYTVTVTVTDNNGGTGSRASSQDIIGYIVIYDPSAGFVTGGGWINSPPGACKLSTCTDGTVGKANFGFNAKYKKGANVPDGNTEFQFQAGGLNFKSTDYSWLVVAGSKAQYKGTGTINGRGTYGFMLTALDGDLKSKGSPDSFRIKIWDANGTVYDNQMGALDDSDAATTLGGGSIVIHQ